MLWSEQRRKLYVGVLVKKISGMLKPVINRSLIADQTDSCASQEIDSLLEQFLQSKFDGPYHWLQWIHLKYSFNSPQPHSTDPPFTLSISPVTCRAQSLHRKTIGPAMSSAG